MINPKLDPWTEGYLSYLVDVRRMASGTIRDVRCTMKRVCESMAKLCPDTALWKLTLEDYLRWINYEREAGRTSNTLAKDLSHIRGLLDYAWRSGRSDRNVLDGFSLQDSVRSVAPRVLCLDEAKRLLEVCGSKNKIQRRDRMVVLLLYGCGLRTNELRELDLADIDLERQEIFVRQGKGDRQRTIPVASAVWTELLAYLSERDGKRGALFRTEIKKKKLNASSISEIVKNAARSAGLRGEVTPKTLRHTFATHLMDKGVDLAVISSLMGHRSPQETGVYLHVLPGKAQNAVTKLAI